MKLSKTSLIALIIGVIVIAAASLGWTYSQQSEQQKQLDSKLTQAKQKLAGIKFDELYTQKDQLTRQIEQVNAQIADIKTRLSFSSDSIDATNIILQDAKSHRVDILEMTSSGINHESLVGTNCETLSIVIKVKGTLQNISDLAVSLSQRFPTSVDKAVQIDRVPPPAPTPTPTPTPTGTSTPTGTPTPTPAPGTPTPPPGFTPIVAPEKDFSANISVVIYNYKGE